MQDTAFKSGFTFILAVYSSVNYLNHRPLFHNPPKLIKRALIGGLAVSIMDLFRRWRLQEHMLEEEWKEVMFDYGSCLQRDIRIVEQNEIDVEKFYKYFSIEL